jgi:hypothetical protein
MIGGEFVCVCEYLDCLIHVYKLHSPHSTMRIKVTGHPFWRFVENRYCALKISPIFIKFSPNVKYDKVVKWTNNKIM